MDNLIIDHDHSFFDSGTTNYQMKHVAFKNAKMRCNAEDTGFLHCKRPSSSSLWDQVA